LAQGVSLFYGSTTGNTARVAELIEKLWDSKLVLQLVDIAESGVSPMVMADKLILGVPTWDFGELQEDWREEWDCFCDLDFSGKQVALFGLGDQLGYPEWFQDAMGVVANQVTSAGGELIGDWPNEGYSFEASRALLPGSQSFCGLALDEDSQSWATEERVEAWLVQITEAFEPDTSN